MTSRWGHNREKRDTGPALAESKFIVSDLSTSNFMYNVMSIVTEHSHEDGGGDGL